MPNSSAGVEFSFRSKKCGGVLFIYDTMISVGGMMKIGTDEWTPLHVSWGTHWFVVLVLILFMMSASFFLCATH